MFYERELPPTMGGEAARQRKTMCRSYVAATIQPQERARIGT